MRAGTITRLLQNGRAEVSVERDVSAVCEACKMSALCGANKPLVVAVRNDAGANVGDAVMLAKSGLFGLKTVADTPAVNVYAK